MIGKSICFTGHRSISRRGRPALLEKLRHTLRRAIDEGFTDFYAGGALGWDTYCALEVIALRMEFNWIALHLVLPCAPEAQTLHWTNRQKRRYQEIMQEANTVEILSDDYTEKCMKRRNAKLVEYADCCIAYCLPEAYHSGTKQTVRMANEKGIPVINLAEDPAE